MLRWRQGPGGRAGRRAGAGGPSLRLPGGSSPSAAAPLLAAFSPGPRVCRVHCASALAPHQMLYTAVWSTTSAEPPEPCSATLRSVQVSREESGREQRQAWEHGLVSDSAAEWERRFAQVRAPRCAERGGFQTCVFCPIGKSYLGSCSAPYCALQRGQCAAPRPRFSIQAKEGPQRVP